MTRAYKKIMEQRENNLFVAVAHKVAKRMEIKADRVGYEIDTDIDWIDVHTLLLDYEYNGMKLTAEGRAYIAQTLEGISVRVGYDFWRGFIYYLSNTNI